MQVFKISPTSEDLISYMMISAAELYIMVDA